MRSSVRACSVVADGEPRFVTTVIIKPSTAIMSPMPGTLLLVISIAIFSSIGSVTWSLESCTTNSQCQSNSCCLLGPSRYAKPTCMPYQQKGEQCRVNADTITTILAYPDNSQIEVEGVHYILCPCAEGLSCDRGICN